MWYVIVADAQRAASAAVGPAHVARLTALRDEGRLLLAGPCPGDRCRGSGPGRIQRQPVVAEFTSLDDARAWADADPYVAAGVYTPRRRAPVQAGSCHERCRANSAWRDPRMPAMRPLALRAGCWRSRTTATSTSATPAPATGRGHFRVDVVSAAFARPDPVGPPSGGLCRAGRDDGHRHPRPVDPGADPGRGAW